jgi:hypothetical protein
MKVEVKKFTTNCNTNAGGISPVTFYIGHPAKDSHPLAFQSRWLSDRGISVPQHIMESFSKLMDISIANNLPFIDLVEYVIKEVELGKSLQNDMKKASEISDDTKEELKESTIKIQVEDSQNHNEEIIKDQKEISSENNQDIKVKQDNLKLSDNLKSNEQAISLNNDQEIYKNISQKNDNSSINYNLNSNQVNPADPLPLKAKDQLDLENGSKSLFKKISKEDK